MRQFAGPQAWASPAKSPFFKRLGWLYADDCHNRCNAFLAAFASAIEARELSKSHRFACTWGSDIAAGAQQSKLSGISLYGARKQLQVRKFQQP